MAILGQSWTLADLGVDVIKRPGLINGYRHCGSSVQHDCYGGVWHRVDIAGFGDGSAGPQAMSVPW